MKIYTEILGNISSPEWAGRLHGMQTEYIDLDQWTAQKSRLTARGDRGSEYAVALERGVRLSDGDVIDYRPAEGRIAVIRLRLSEVMVADLGSLTGAAPETILRTALELGHAIGNQHWAAVVKGTKVYVPLTVDRKVMESVMRTHRIEGVEVSFVPGDELIPYFAPHEIRRLFGGSGPTGETHDHHHGRFGGEDGGSHCHEHSHGNGREHCHEHSHEHGHEHGCGHHHRHRHENEHEHAWK